MDGNFMEFLDMKKWQAAKQDKNKSWTQFELDLIAFYPLLGVATYNFPIPIHFYPFLPFYWYVEHSRTEKNWEERLDDFHTSAWKSQGALDPSDLSDLSCLQESRRMASVMTH